MLFGRYRFQAVFTGPAILPPYKGSTFRGVFGTALKKVTCTLRHQECGTCILRQTCAYARVFEPGGAPGQPTPPHPFVIEPPLTPATNFQPGDAFDFGLLLFGWANDYLPYFIYALEEMGRLGVGKKIAGARGTFQLLQVQAADEVIYETQERILRKPQLTRLELTPPPAPPVREITVELLTPLRLKFRNTLRAELPFHLLIRGTLRRVATLNQCFGAGEPPLDYRGLVARAEQVELAAADLRWHDWRRYSNRQDQAMLMGGITGWATYRGELTEFIPLLEYAAQVHLGKATTFGLGQLRLHLPS